MAEINTVAGNWQALGMSAWEFSLQWLECEGDADNPVLHFFRSLHNPCIDLCGTQRAFSVKLGGPCISHFMSVSIQVIQETRMNFMLIISNDQGSDNWHRQEFFYYDC
jgi:hypothetical protein